MEYVEHQLRMTRLMNCSGSPLGGFLLIMTSGNAPFLEPMDGYELNRTRTGLLAGWLVEMLS
jgi:hypothetical protein